MNIQEIIAKKRDKQKLSKEEIDFFIKEYTNGNIADYQASALLMAIYLNGMKFLDIQLLQTLYLNDYFITVILST